MKCALVSPSTQLVTGHEPIEKFQIVQDYPKHLHDGTSGRPRVQLLVFQSTLGMIPR